MRYYYLASMLPWLSLGTPPAISFDNLLRLCRVHLSDSDREALEELLRGAQADSSHPFVRDWVRLETLVRNAICRHRATRWPDADVTTFLRPRRDISLFIEKEVADAFAKPTPLDRERALDRLRWVLLDELAGFDPFGGPAILAYAIKLTLAERWASLHADRGVERVRAVVNRDPAPWTSAPAPQPG